MFEHHTHISSKEEQHLKYKVAVGISLVAFAGTFLHHPQMTQQEKGIVTNLKKTVGPLHPNIATHANVILDPQKLAWNNLLSVVGIQFYTTVPVSQTVSLKSDIDYSADIEVCTKLPEKISCFNKTISLDPITYSTLKVGDRLPISSP